MKASAVSATSRHPLSMTSACPRLGSSTISVTPGLRFCLLYEPSAMAPGAVLSFSPQTMSSGPRSGFLVSTLTSVHGLTFSPLTYEQFRFGFANAVSEDEAKGRCSRWRHRSSPPRAPNWNSPLTNSR